MNDFVLPRLLAAGALAAMLPASGKELTGVYTPAAGPCPDVATAIARMTVPDGYEVRNFAAEPLVVNPVAMTWDARGRLWVVELFEYPRGARTPNDYSKLAADEKWRPVLAGGGPDWPRDRVVILEDTDNDGRADKRTVFLDGLNLATGIALGHGGAFVGQAPNLFFFRDSNGDDKADEFKSVLTGFGLEDRHELLNGFTWGPDGYLYFTHGVFTHSKVRRPTEPKESGFIVNAGIFRVQFDASSAESGPTAARYEVFADGTSNPWGLDFDAAGNAFVSACVIDHLFHMAPGGLYHRQGGSPEYPYGYEWLPSIVSHKHFRAAYAGVDVYQGGVYPDDTRGHLFIGNIHDNAIHEERLEPAGASFKAAPVRDFLRANDGWFRPVSTRTGPDGHLWIMDWCDKYPCYQNAQANPEGVDRERGRIWRVVRRDGKSPGSRGAREMDLAARPAEELVTLLGDGNAWTRRMAQRLLTEKSGSGIDDRLTRAVREGAGREVRLAALWTLHARGRLRHDRAGSTGLLESLAGEQEPAIRLWVARLIGENGAWEAARGSIMERLARDPDAAVRLAVAVACRQSTAGDLTRVPPAGARQNVPNPATPVVRELMESSAATADRTLSFVIWTALEPELARFPGSWLPEAGSALTRRTPLSLALAPKIMRRLCDARDPAMIDAALEFAGRFAGDGELLASALDGLVKGQEAGAVRPTRDASAEFQLWSKHEREDVRQRSGQLATLWGDPAAVRALVVQALDAKAGRDNRLAAVKTLRKLRSDTARDGIRRLLAAESDPALVTEAIRAATELGGDEFPALILSAWGRDPAIRTVAAEGLTSRSSWATALLEAVERGSRPPGAAVGPRNAPAVDPATLPATVRRYFATAAPKDLQSRATSVLGRWNETPGDLKRLIADRRAACLEGEPDLGLGKEIFTATCATCHRFFGGGVEVGPDLIGSGRSNLDALLTNIIDPNQIIGRGYENFILTTRDGRTLTGRLIEETPTRVRLLGITAREEVVARDQIAKMENTGQSVMPMGFAALPDDQFRSLVWYILAPPDEGPLTQERKAALSRPIDSPEPAASPPAKSAAEPAEVRVDWESVSLWNPDWKLTAPEFEGTPRKRPEFCGRKNVLEIHPFEETRKRPAVLARRVPLPGDRPARLEFSAAAHESGDWQLIVSVDQREVKRQLIGHDGERWREIVVDLGAWKGQAPEIRIEAWANNWAWEFAYLADLRID